MRSFSYCTYRAFLLSIGKPDGPYNVVFLIRAASVSLQIVCSSIFKTFPICLATKLFSLMFFNGSAIRRECVVWTVCAPVLINFY